MKKTVSGIMLTLQLIGMLTLAFNIQPSKASGTINIMPDGSIVPATAPISTVDNITYTFTGNINDFLVIQRSNIIVDGAGYTLYGNGSGRGIDFLSFGYLYNITIRHMEIRDFEYSIFAEWCVGLNISRNNIIVGVPLYGVWLHWSWNNIIVGNNLTSAWGGVAIDLNTSPDNTLAENYISGNEHGIRLNNSLNCRIVRNDIVSNEDAIELTDSSDNNILAGNNVTTTVHGIDLSTSSNNTLAENKITDITDGYGICLKGSSNNSLTENNVIGYEPFSQQGIWLNSSSNNNTLAGNIITKNKYGISLTGSSNNTLSENNATANEYGIWLGSSSNNTLTENNATANGCGICLIDSSDNNILEENDIEYGWNGISLRMSSNNTLVKNNIPGPEYGIDLTSSSNNTLAENNVTGAFYGISLDGSSDNRIYHNDFVNNVIQADIVNSVCAWDDDYPSGGNYWSDYSGTDLYQGPYQNETGNDNIGDTPHTINVNNTDRYPLMDLWTPFFDIAVLNVTLSKTVVGQGFSVSIDVTVENQGIWPQAFNMTIYAFTMPPAIPIVTLTVPYLAPQTSKTLRFTWNTTGFAKGNYTISAYATPVLGEIDTADNNLVDGLIEVTVIGDINGDFKVDIKDLVLVIKHYASYPGHPKWNANADINSDNKVDIKDLVLVIKHFGEHYP